MIRINELVGMMVAALLLLIAPTRPGAAATEDRSMHQVKQEFGKLNPNAPAELSRFSFLIGNWHSLPTMLSGANAFEISDIERMNIGAH
jgi:hypothetical protein